MKRQLLAAVLVVAVIGAFLFLVFRQTEPVVNGKPVSYWIGATPYDPGETFATIGAANRAMDERCVRWLEMELDWRPARFRDAIAKIFNHIFYDAMPWKTPRDRRMLAASALGNLGERAMPAVPALKKAARTTVEPDARQVRAAAKATLIHLGQESLQAHVDFLRDASDFETWNEGLDTLRWLGTNAAPAISVFADIVLSANDVHLRNRAAALLGDMRLSPETCVPALVRVLSEPQMRYNSLEALRAFGPGARSATDAIVSCLTDTDKYVRMRAVEALRAINPEKAASLTDSPTR